MGWYIDDGVVLADEATLGKLADELHPLEHEGMLLRELHRDVGHAHTALE